MHPKKWVNPIQPTRFPVLPPISFAPEEWRRGLKALRVDTVSKLKKALPEQEKEVRRPSNFVDFYSYSFCYCLTEEKQKSIDIESICQLLDLVLGSQFRAQVDYFIEYLKIQSDYKVINLDQWMGFFRFCNKHCLRCYNVRT
ncbi:DCN1-like protein 1 [Gossypium hirsutum]|uniref:Defective in cullin neddylation protein n=1 Tax=Gossypium hirsutum TaxID=3635 RepID=A0A1U8JTB2_GOSHI|nr:DCN1-like protein 1 [Gossypium hirsutum]